MSDTKQPSDRSGTRAGTRPARLARRGVWTIAIATAASLVLVRVTGDLQAPGMVLVAGLVWGGFLLLVALATHLGGLGEEDLRQERRPGERG